MPSALAGNTASIPGMCNSLPAHCDRADGSNNSSNGDGKMICWK